MRLLIALIVAATLAGAGEPLPLKSAKLAGTTYTLDGRHTLKKGARLHLGPRVRVVGKGEGAVIDLEGSLQVAGEPGAEVTFENVWVNLPWKFAGLEVAHARFEGSGGVVVPHEEETRGKLLLEHVAFAGDASVWVTFHEGKLELRHVTARSTCQIAGTAPDRNVKLDIQSCRFLTTDTPGVIKGGLRLHNVKEARVMNTQVGGMNASFVGGVKLTLEGCRFDARGFSVGQQTKGRFGKTRIVRCDFAEKGLRFLGPEGGSERVTLKECHFAGADAADPKAIERDWIEAKGVRVVVKSPSPTPHGLAKQK